MTGPRVTGHRRAFNENFTNGLASFESDEGEQGPILPDDAWRNNRGGDIDHHHVFGYGRT